MFQLLSRIQQPAHKCQCSTKKTRGSRLAARSSRNSGTSVLYFRLSEPRAASRGFFSQLIILKSMMRRLMH
jgi:hypothetical protein